MFGAKYSSGGSTSGLGAIQLGLGLTVHALHGRVRVTVDGSGPLPAPIQQSLGRVWFAIAF